MNRTLAKTMKTVPLIFYEFFHGTWSDTSQLTASARAEKNPEHEVSRLIQDFTGCH